MRAVFKASLYFFGVHLLLCRSETNVPNRRVEIIFHFRQMSCLTQMYILPHNFNAFVTGCLEDYSVCSETTPVHTENGAEATLVKVFDMTEMNLVNNPEIWL